MDQEGRECVSSGEDTAHSDELANALYTRPFVYPNPYISYSSTEDDAGIKRPDMSTMRIIGKKWKKAFFENISERIQDLVSKEAEANSAEVIQKRIKEYFTQINAEIEKLNPPIETDETAINEFDTLKCLAEGWFSNTCLAMCKSTRMKVVMKTYDMNTKGIFGHLRRVQDIYCYSVLLNRPHPFLDDLLRIFTHDGRMCLIMRYYENQSLFHIQKANGAFTLKVAKFYIAELISAIEHLHAIGVIHTCIKPENLFLSNAMHLILSDFSSSVIKEFLTDSQVAGRRLECVYLSYTFLAPETFFDDEFYEVSDVWATACCLYEFLAGLITFHPHWFRSQISRRVLIYPEKFPVQAQALLNKLLITKPESRLGAPLMGGISSIKQDAFFDDVHWDTLSQQKPPRIVPYLPTSEDDNECCSKFANWSDVRMKVDDYENPPFRTSMFSIEEQLQMQKRLNKYHLYSEGCIISKFDELFRRTPYNRRKIVLLLIEKPAIKEIDTCVWTTVNIPLCKQLRVELIDHQIFMIRLPNRSYFYADQTGNAKSWCVHINDLRTRHFDTLPDFSTETNNLEYNLGYP